VLGSVARGQVPFVLDLTSIGLPVLAIILVGVIGAAVAVRRVTSVDPLVALGSAR